MAWDDPSPRQRGRAAATPAAGPGYSTPQRGVSLATILGRSAAAIFAAVLVFLGTHAALVAWHGQGASHDTANKGIALVLAILAGALVLRHLSDPAAWRPRDGFGWSGRRRAWDDGYGYPTLGEQVVADVVEGVIDGVARAID
jgi:hypothetical protein